MQDIFTFCVRQKVTDSPKLQSLAEIKAADLVPHTLDRRLCIFRPEYVGAVLTASFSPAAPIQSIETEVPASGNMGAVPRGNPELSPSRRWFGLSLCPAHTGKNRELSRGYQERKRKRAMPC